VNGLTRNWGILIIIPLFLIRFVNSSFVCILVCFAKYVSPLWSTGQSSWLQIQRSRVRFPALSDFLRSGGSGTVSYLEEIVAPSV
jgi:hypothetical protein